VPGGDNMSILDQIILMRTTLLVTTGKTPTEIRLSPAQKEELHNFIEANRLNTIPCESLEEKIFGMTIK
jgi:hypothetical protein